MMHKLRAVMGKRDDMYTLCNSIEIDEGFFEGTHTAPSQKVRANGPNEKKGKATPSS